MPEKSIEMAGKSIGMSGKSIEMPWKGTGMKGNPPDYQRSLPIY